MDSWVELGKRPRAHRAVRYQELHHVTSVSQNFIASHWPRIRRLFSVLDLDRPDLACVREAWLAGKTQTACVELVAYFEGRRLEPSLLWEQRATAEEHRRWADSVLEDEFELQGLNAKVPRRPDRGLDWNNRGPHGDTEWTCFLNRHDFFRSLLRAWQQTGDERSISIRTVWQAAQLPQLLPEASVLKSPVLKNCWTLAYPLQADFRPFQALLVELRPFQAFLCFRREFPLN